MPAVLVTQCLQHDFVGPVRTHDPLPNRLHVGAVEARRLLGADPATGPVAQLVAWARAGAKERLDVVHIRDWHDPADPRQEEHLRAFGPHCLRGTRGAEFVFEGAALPHEQVVDSLALSDFEGTDLQHRLQALRARAGGAPLRVGVVGVWTDAKVSFLAYDLKTRLGVDEIATCSALTASSSRAQHFNALDQLSRLLGVRCFESVGEFQRWLRPDAVPALPPAPARSAPRTRIAGAGAALSQTDRDIVGWLYRDSAEVELAPLSGGFSGALVFKASSIDALGQRQAPSVVKVGPQQLVAKERVAFERVEEVLGNNAPAVRGFVDLGERAGIKYSFAAMGAGRVTTFKSLYGSGAPAETVDSVLETVFGEILAPMYQAARWERLPLLDHYGFSASMAPRVRSLVEGVVGPQLADAPRLPFPGGLEAPNVRFFYEHALAGDSLPRNDFRYVATAHGDLNGANILVDARSNVWVIDWFHAGPAHVLKDLAKLENDLLYIFTPLADEAELVQALELTRALLAVRDLRQPLPEEAPALRAEPLRRAWRTLRTLRSFVARYCREDRRPLQLHVALLRYAVHTLSFEESSPLQKRWALFAAGLLADDLVAAAQSDRAPLRVDWLPSRAPGAGRIGLTLCPGRQDRGRRLAEDLAELRSAGASRLLCLLPDEELEWAGVADLRGQAAAHGLEFRQTPVRDQGVPTLGEAQALVRWCREAIDSGRDVVVHCMGGLGRSGTLAACVLAAQGLGAEEAIGAVRAARDPRAVETVEQERFVRRFAESGSPTERVAG